MPYWSKLMQLSPGGTGEQRIFMAIRQRKWLKPVSIICPSDRKNEPLQIIERIKRREKGISLNTIRVTKDGIRKHISLTVSPIFDMYGKLTHFSTIERDITELVKTEEELRRREYQLHAILNHLPVGVWYTMKRTKSWEIPPDAEFGGMQEAVSRIIFRSTKPGTPKREGELNLRNGR